MPAAAAAPVVVISPLQTRKWRPPQPPAMPDIASLPFAAPVARGVFGVLSRLGLLRYKIALKTLPIVVGALVARAVLEEGLGFEGMILDSVVSSFTWPCMMAIGVLLQGVIEDYKEAERIPGQIAVVCDSLAERVWWVNALRLRALQRGSGAAPEEGSAPVGDAEPASTFDPRALHTELLELLTTLFEFLAGLRSCSEMLSLVTATGMHVNSAFLGVEGGDAVSWEVWASVEALRGFVQRIEVIRRTDFLPAGGVLIRFITFAIVVLVS